MSTRPLTGAGRHGAKARPVTDEPAAFEDMVAPDHARLSAGWQRRFVAHGARADEMTQLYRDLGFEVVADPVTPSQIIGQCADCSLLIQLKFRTIYTRRPVTARGPS